MTKEETSRLLDFIDNKKHRLIVELLYSAGLRVNELVNLKVIDFEFSKNYGWVRGGKGGKDRLFIIANRLNKKLQDFIEENILGCDSYLFEGNKGGHISRETVGMVIKKAARKVGIKKRVRCHTLRHSFATHLIENGYDVTSVQSLLGHNSSETTMVYIHMASPRMIGVKSPLDELPDKQ